MWPQMGRLERDLTVIGAAAIGVAALVGGALGWAAYELAGRLRRLGDR